jgi:hypothetical protein
VIPIVQVVEVLALAGGLFDLAQKGLLEVPAPSEHERARRQARPGKEAETEAEASRSAEIRKIIEQYADDLRQVIKKLRKLLH